jgi:propionyl-CoA synthetase
VISADAGSRGGKVVAYKPLLDEAIRLASRTSRSAVLLVDRGLAPMDAGGGPRPRLGHAGASTPATEVPCTWLDATDTSYTIYTSGTTGGPRACSATSAAMRWRWPPA